MRELHIMMLGARFVGKTSLLTAMYYEYEQTTAKTRIQLTPDDDTSHSLQKKLAELKSLNDNYEEGGVESTEAAAGAKSIRSFIFDCGQKGKKPALRLHFWDYPGGYAVELGNQDGSDFVKEYLSKSNVVLIAIDTPALMEGNGKWHQERNRPQQIYDKFKQVYQDIKSPRLVILAPIKCENYLKSKKSNTQLLQKIKQEYKDLLGFFEALRDNIAVVVTPVQTVGTVFFSHIETIERGSQVSPRFHFKKPNPDAQFSPKDNEQPLKYLLRFLLNFHLKKRFLFNALLSDLFGRDDYLKEAITEFSKDCKTEDGFEVIQGQNFLDINRSK